MKRKLIIFLVLIAGLPFIVSAQVNPLNEMIKLYNENDGFHFLDLTTNLMTAKAEDGTKAYDKIINLKMISFDENQNSSYKAANLYNQFFDGIDKRQYKGLVDVKSSGENMEMLIRKDGDKLVEVIIALQEEDEMTIIAATGNFDMKDLSQFKNMHNCHGMELLQQLCEE